MAASPLKFKVSKLDAITEGDMPQFASHEAEQNAVPILRGYTNILESASNEQDRATIAYAIVRISCNDLRQHGVPDHQIALAAQVPTYQSDVNDQAMLNNIQTPQNTTQGNAIEIEMDTEGNDNNEDYTPLPKSVRLADIGKDLVAMPILYQSNTAFPVSSLTNLLADLRGITRRGQNNTVIVLPDTVHQDFYNFITHGILGNGAITHICRTLKHLTGASEKHDGITVALLQRAKTGAKDTNIHDSLRGFFQIFERTVRHALAERKDLPTQLMDMNERVDMLSVYSNMKVMLTKQKKGPLAQFLVRRHKGSKSGVRLHSLLFKFLVDYLGIPHIQLSNYFAQLGPLGVLVAHFGRGVLVMLPKEMILKLHRVGRDAVNEIAIAAVKNIPQIREIAARLEVSVLRPLIMGKAVKWGAAEKAVTVDWDTFLDFLDETSQGEADYTEEEYVTQEGIMRHVATGKELVEESDMEMEDK